ncbi:MAG: STAS domain-containing protein [candidate division Zixibacteria bacterium]
MEDIRLSLSQAGPSGELSIIRADGVVDTLTASELEVAIDTLLRQDKYKILIDLGGVDYISSAGWGIFVSKIQEIRQKSGDIKLVNMIPNVYEIYELLEFEHIIQAFDSIERGKDAFNISHAESPNTEKVWKTADKIVDETGNRIQSAFSPGTKSRTQRDSGIVFPNAEPEEIIVNLVAEDPFSSISELVQDASELAPKVDWGWWRIFGILRRKKLLSRRSRFRLSRRKIRGR